MFLLTLTFFCRYKKSIAVCCQKFDEQEAYNQKHGNLHVPVFVDLKKSCNMIISDSEKWVPDCFTFFLTLQFNFFPDSLRKYDSNKILENQI